MNAPFVLRLPFCIFLKGISVVHIVLLALSFLVQASLAVHAYRTGRDRWMYLIILVPIVGSLIYILTELLPEIRYSSTGRKAASRITGMIAPSDNMAKLRERLALLDSVENRQLLARECVKAEEYDEAIELYTSCLKGIYKNDLQLMLELANANYLSERYLDTRDVFVRLREAHPEFKHAEGHLLLARTLEILGDDLNALREYKEVANYYPGEEAICRYALLLKKMECRREANEIFEKIVLRSRIRGRKKTRRDRQWIATAQENIEPSASLRNGEN